jgi:hypothetical protein
MTQLDQHSTSSMPPRVAASRLVLPVPDPVQLEDFCAATAAGRLGNPAKIQGHLAGGEQIVPCVASARKSFHPGDWFLERISRSLR